jgi:hypothetical protein
MRRAIGLLLLGGTLALLAAGCGGGSSGPKPLDKADYVKQMQAIGRKLSTSLNGLTADTGSAPKAAAALTTVQGELRAAAVKIAAIDPPTDIKTEHAQLATAVSEFADELGPLITKLKAGNLQALTTLTKLKGVSDIQKASTAISNKGYKIGG